MKLTKKQYKIINDNIKLQIISNRNKFIYSKYYIIFKTDLINKFELIFKKSYISNVFNYFDNYKSLENEYYYILIHYNVNNNEYKIIDII